MGMYSALWRRVLGLISFLLGLILGILLLKIQFFSEHGHKNFLAFWSPGLLMTAGVHWMRGKIFHTR